MPSSPNSMSDMPASLSCSTIESIEAMAPSSSPSVILASSGKLISSPPLPSAAISWSIWLICSVMPPSSKAMAPASFTADL